MANRAALIRAENAGLPVKRRGRRFIEFDLGNGQTRHVATIERLHKADNTTEIDTTWVADTGAWQWRISQADFQVHARDIFNAGNLLEWRHSSGEWIIVDPQSINWINEVNSREQIAIKQAVTGVANDMTLSFPAGYGPGRHFEYTAHPQRLIKHITIDSLANLPTPTITGTINFEAEWSLSTSTGIDFYLDGVKWEKVNGVRVRTANRIEFRNTANTETLWYADAPVATDANGETVNCQYEVRRQGGPSALFITVRVPKTWIDTAAFPIQIDPTFTDGYGGDVTTAKDTGVNSTAATYNYGTYVRLMQSSSDALRALLEFDLSSIASGSTCGSATFYSYQVLTNSAGATLTIYSIASGNAAWTEGAQAGALAAAGEPCWNALAADGAGGVTTAWAGSAGLSTSGTDYEASSIGSFTVGTSDPAGTQYTAALTTTRVAGWFGASNTNYGILIRNQSTLELGRLATSDDGTTGRRPKLVVDYTEVSGDYSVAKSEGVTLGESRTVALSDAEAAKSEGVTLGETAVADVEITASLSDGVTLGEAVTVVLDDLAISKSEGVTLGEAVTASLPDALAVNAADGITAGESNAQALGDLAVSKAEGVTLGEAAAAAIADDLAVSQSEGVTLGESANASVGTLPDQEIAASDEVTLGESNAQELVSFISKSDGVTVGEAATVDLRAAWYNPDSITANTGSIVSGTIEDTWSDNGVKLQLSEVIGTPGFDYDFYFYDVPADAYSLTINGYYQGNAGHNVKIQQWNFTTEAWTNLTAETDDFPATTSDQNYQFALFGGANYNSGGQVRIKIIHTTAGSNTHNFFVDQMAMSSQNLAVHLPDEGVTLGESYAVAMADDLAISVSDGVTVGEAANVLLEVLGELYVTVSDGVTVADGGAIMMGDLGIMIDPADLIYWTAGVEVV